MRKQRPHILALISAASLLAAQPASALTLAEAVEQAIVRSPEVAALTSQVEIQQARQEFAGHAGLPQVGLDGGMGGQYSNLFGRGASVQFRKDIGGNVTQRLWDWQRTGNAVEAAARRSQVAQLDVDLARDRTAFNTAEAYLNVMRRRLLLRQTQVNITYHRWLVDSARERVAKNQLAKARLTELEARLAPLAVDKIDQEANLGRAIVTLMELAGSVDNLSMPPEADVDARALRDVDAFVDASLSAHPAIQRANLAVEAAQRDLDSIRGAFWPSVDAQLSTRYLDEAEGLRGLQWDNQALLRMNWGLFGQGVPAQVKEAEATHKVASAQLRQARQEVTLDLRRYATTLKAIEDQEAILKEYQKAAKFSMDAGMEYLKKTAHFATDMLALADLISIRYQAEGNLISNHVDRQITELRLLQAAGRLVPTLQRAARK
ncbi:MAG: type secretion outer membrane protein TolC family [Cyanobacteria bacterium RYN_339]|nr:type secretion outer membrane protein TolC family [Cyanobacteria bacterium RYN_339]